MLIQAVKAVKTYSEKGDIHSNGEEVLVIGEAAYSLMYLFISKDKYVLAVKEKFTLTDETEEIELSDEIADGIKAAFKNIKFYEKKI